MRTDQSVQSTMAISKRDWRAMFCMAGFAVKYGANCPFHLVAQVAYQAADALEEASDPETKKIPEKIIQEFINFA